MSYCNSLHRCKLQQPILSELLTPYSLPLLSFCTPFSCGCLPISFVRWIPSYWSFSSTIFHKCRWWCHGCFTTPSIVASFINTLFQMNSASCHLAFVVILPIVINDNGRCIDFIFLQTNIIFYGSGRCNTPILLWTLFVLGKMITIPFINAYIPFPLYVFSFHKMYKNLILVYEWFILQEWKWKKNYMFHLLVLCVSYGKWTREFELGGFKPIIKWKRKPSFPKWIGLSWLLAS